MCAQIRNVDLNIYTKSSLCETKTWFQQKETVVKLSRFTCVCVVGTGSSSRSVPVLLTRTATGPCDLTVSRVLLLFTQADHVH